MPNSPSTSFIPKQGPVKSARKTATRQIHLLSIISYVLFTATIVTVIGLFLFNRHVDSLLRAEVETLNSAIVNFSDADMERVKEFNIRLLQTRERLSNSVSVVSLLESLEGATAKNVMIEDFKLKRETDDQIVLAVKVKTDSFDSSLFQRGVFERNEVIDTVSIEELGIADTVDAEGDLIEEGVTFVAKIGVPSTAIPPVSKREIIPAAVSFVATSSIQETQIATSTQVREGDEVSTESNQTNL